MLAYLFQAYLKLSNASEELTFGAVIISTITGLISVVLGYAGYRIAKYTYVANMVKTASAALKKEIQEDKSRIQESIARWRESEEYSNLLKIAEGVAVEDYISTMNFEKLLLALRNDEISAYSTLKSFQIKAIESTEKCNNIVGWINEADQMARDLDKLPKDQRKAFHGVPMSIKECFAIKNTHSNSGMMYFNTGKANYNAANVQTCINLGAVPFCKTNVPQAMYSMQCDNPLYGTTGNPHNPAREAGGSSGGEASLIGGKGSILGIGSDIGGSLRNPAACCGIYSMRPTNGRHLSNLGCTPTAGSDPARMETVAGFMAATPDILEYSWRTYYDLDDIDNETKIDPMVAPIKFSKQRFDKKVKIGYFYSEGLYEPVPGVKRAIDEAIETLRDAGYEVIKFEPPNFDKVWSLLNGIICGDMSLFERNMDWDLTSSSLKWIKINNSIMKLPAIIRKLILNPLSKLMTDVPTVEKYFTKTSELYQALDEKHELAIEYFQSMEKAGVDVILCPGQIVPALPAGIAGHFVPVLFPYLMCNVLNLPAGIAPVTKYNETDDKLMKDYPISNQTYKLIHQYTRGAVGLPLAVQVVARPYHEEYILKIMKVLHQNGTYRV